jgi:error-prone DNA polymerase
MYWSLQTHLAPARPPHPKRTRRTERPRPHPTHSLAPSAPSAPRAAVSYVELHTSSAFSFLRGASLPETLIERAAALGYPALALLDRDGVYGLPRFYQAAKSAGIRAIVGAELTIAPGGSNPRAGGGGTAAGSRETAGWVLPLLVESQQGWRNLCRLVTRMKLRAPKGEGALTLDDFDGMTAGLVAMPGRPLLLAERYGVGGLLDQLVGLFGRGNIYVELQRHLRRDQEDDNDTLICLADAFRVPLVATGGVRFASPEERPLFDVLTSIREGTTLEAAGRRLAANAERYLKAPAQMARLYADQPDAVQASLVLAERLQFTMKDLGYKFPTYPTPPGESEISFLRQITEIGARERYRPYHDKARAQIARELDLIEKLQLAGYFLIVWDIVNYCRQHDVLAQGRGSAANSAVCYSLGITAVDPVGMDLLFERFLSEERGEWPDIDIDLPSGDRRESVIQHVYEKYGKHGAAMTANVITYRGRSAAREVGKVLGLDQPVVDRLAKVMNQFEFVDPADTLSRNMKAAGLDPGNRRVQHFAKLWLQMQDLPRHLGQHSGGMVICQHDLSSVVPLENASMPNRVVVQWDKDDCADMGLIKVDLLGLGMMAVLQDAMGLIRAGGAGEAGGAGREAVDLAHLPQDPAVYTMLQAADTIGVFQVESRAQMATLPRLKPTCFYDLVVQVAIIRPGPIVGQMVHPYLNRRAGREPVVFDHPLLEPVLARTLGVPLFQEQLLRMAMVVAGFSGGQAEELRRAMGFKRSEKKMRQLEVHLREGMAKNGITGEAADGIILSITSFALYGFPESHAASFALIAYASAYLKTHYPAAFYTALLNNQPMGFYHPATLVKDAQRRGVRFAPVDVQLSDWDCIVSSDGVIRLGLRYVTGLREEIGKRIAAAPFAVPVSRGTDRLVCPKCGCDDPSMIDRADGCFCNVCSHHWTVYVATARRFATLDEFVRRIGLRRDEVTTLAEVGALNSFGLNRRSALWQAERVVRPAGELFTHGEGEPDDGDMTSGEARSISAGAVDDTQTRSPLLAMTPTERLIADYAGTKLTIGPHPMSFRRHELSMRGIMPATQLPHIRTGRRVRTAGMVITRQRPGTAKGFVFLTLEDETGVANIIVRPDFYDQEKVTLVQAPFLIVEGIVQTEDGVTAIRAEKVWPLEGFSADAAIESHDFH